MKTNTIKAVLFDLDGTLVDVRERLYRSCQYAFEYMHLVEPDELSYWEAFQEFDLSRFIPEPLRTEFFTHMLDHYCTFTGDVQLIPGALEALQYCQAAGYGTGVITSRTTPPEHVRAELERAHLAPFIHIIKTHQGVDIPAVLAKEDRLLEAIGELGVTPKQSIYVGDLPDDIMSARRAGLSGSVAVLSGGINRTLLDVHNPDVILNSVGDLPEYLRQRHGETEPPASVAHS